jgi:hypothetical protein
MKYVLLFWNNLEDQARWDTLPEEARNEAFARVFGWLEENSSVVQGGDRLQGPETATTIRFPKDSPPVVTDGPFMESNEIIGGYVLVDVDDLDAALKLAKSWPPRGPIEVRPIIDHSAA